MSLFNKIISIQRAVETQDGQGTVVQDWSNQNVTPTTIATGIQASIQQTRQQESEIFNFQSRGFAIDYEIFTESPMPAIQDDRIPDPDIAGVYYRVMAPPENMDGWNWVYRTKCKRNG